MNTKNIMPYLGAVISSSIFGLSFLFTRRAIMVTSAFKLLSLRFLLAFTAMSVLVIFKVIKVDYRNKPIREILIACIAQPVIYFIFETYAIKYTSSSYAGLFIALIPIAVSILGIYALKEMPGKLQWFFILLSVSGVVYIILNDSISVSGNSMILGTVFLFIAIVSASVFSIYSRKISSYFTSFEITYFMMGMAAVVFNAIALVIDICNGQVASYFKPMLNVDVLISVLYLGILSSVVAYYLTNYSLSKMEASKFTVFTNLATIVSIFAGVVFLHETFRFYHVIGSILILAGIVGANYCSIYSAESNKIK